MNTSFPTLTTQRLLLRQITPQDLPNIFKGLSHPDIIKYYGVSYNSLEGTKEQMQWFADLEKNGTGIWWAVCNPETGEFMGAGGFNDLDKTHKKAEIGFWLLPEFWGKGYMKEALTTLCDFAFEHLDLHRIEGFVESENINCKKGMAKLDFELEGTMRDCEVKNGEFISVDIYALVNRQ
ncbi:MAG: N-acetyltransferase [Bacteroidetes bacterium]|nr:MAG: N-acetyltransferase [Bacteroidota bacterium]